MNGNPILWLCGCWLPALVAYLLCNEAAFKKNIVVGVTCPYEAREKPELQEILRRYKRQEKTLAGLLIVLAVAGILIQDSGLSVALFLVWIDLVVILPYIPYFRCNSRLKQYKKEMGWAVPNRIGTSDFSVASQPVRYLHPGWFWLLAAVAVLPVLFDREMRIGYLIDTVSILLLWLCYRYLYRNKSEAVDANTTRTEMLSRMRRYQWGRAFLLCAAMLAATNYILLVGKESSSLMLILLIVLTVAIVSLAVSVEVRTRKAQEELTKGSGKEEYIDDDEHWIGGIFYYNPNDSHLIINERVGLNSSVNLARPAGRILMVLLAVILLLMPLLGVHLMHEERSRIEISVRDNAITVHHNLTTYTVDASAIESAEILETLPALRRVSGSSIDTLRKGLYSSPEYGTMKVCLKTDSGPWLLLITSDGTYLFGSDTADAVEEIAVLLTEKQAAAPAGLSSLLQSNKFNPGNILIKQ